MATRGRYGQLELNFLMRDRLGSVVGVERAQLSGRRIEAMVPETRHGFDAYGAPRANRKWSGNAWVNEGAWALPTRTQQGFTGHERLSGLQLIHMKGRVFDPRLGRFHGVDPVIQFPLSSQGLNPYSYILNNPMAGVDPTGYVACSEVSTTEAGAGTCDYTNDEGQTQEYGYAVGGDGTVAVGSAQNAAALSGLVNAISLVLNGAGGVYPIGTSSSDLGSLGDSARASASNMVEKAKSAASGAIASVFPEASRLTERGDFESSLSDTAWGFLAGLYNTTARGLNDLGDLKYSLHGLDAPASDDFPLVDTPPEMQRGAAFAEVTLTGATILGGLPAQSSRAGRAGVSFVRVGELVPTHGRVMSNKQLDKLIRSIRSEGIREPLTVVEHEGRLYILDGHHRALAAPRAGVPEVPVIQVELPYGAYRSPSDLDFAPGGY